MKYWQNKGRYQELYDKLRTELVPDEGYADTEAGEMIRCMSNVYYDVFNNGGGNLDCSKLGDLMELCFFLNKYDYADPYDITCFYQRLFELTEESPSDRQWGIIQADLDSATDFIVLKAAELSGIAMEQS